MSDIIDLNLRPQFKPLITKIMARLNTQLSMLKISGHNYAGVDFEFSQNKEVSVITKGYFNFSDITKQHNVLYDLQIGKKHTENIERGKHND